MDVLQDLEMKKALAAKKKEMEEDAKAKARIAVCFLCSFVALHNYALVVC